jgi:hypothetical protein
VLHVLAMKLITGEITSMTLVFAGLLGLAFATRHIVEAIKSVKKDAA